MAKDKIVVTEIKVLEDPERVKKAAGIYAKGVARSIRKKAKAKDKASGGEC
ncbi:hypothetical protein [Sporohalobacter salinus]|uniref:hypothetical protein n=1 Tax=Sporohalobacter salinus TaxID=1494606 RepID=UPI00196089BF|nr:hypothetical protein [Sporohalobacter salinus]MBM7623741.1 hypothetical protein [Sporohalobacter salinus]